MEFLQSTALFSDCGKYRFHLSRVWDEAKPAVCWMLLNPSIADAEKLDPTLRRCLGYSIAWGYGAMHVVNIFAYRATNPKDMMAAEDPIGVWKTVESGFPAHNDGYLSLIPGICQLTVAGWGTHGTFNNRHKEVADRLVLFKIPVKCLGKTKNGQPKHPLYLKKDLELIDWP